MTLDDVWRQVVPRPPERVDVRERMQLLRRAEVAQLNVALVVTQNVGTYHQPPRIIYRVRRKSDECL